MQSRSISLPLLCKVAHDGLLRAAHDTHISAKVLLAVTVHWTLTYAHDLLVVLRTPNVFKQNPALASPHGDLPFVRLTHSAKSFATLCRGERRSDKSAVQYFDLFLLQS